jgi:hypothetical protein
MGLGRHDEPAVAAVSRPDASGRVGAGRGDPREASSSPSPPPSASHRTLKSTTLAGSKPRESPQSRLVKWHVKDLQRLAPRAQRPATTPLPGHDDRRHPMASTALPDRVAFPCLWAAWVTFGSVRCSSDRTLSLWVQGSSPWRVRYSWRRASVGAPPHRPSRKPRTPRQLGPQGLERLLVPARWVEDEWDTTDSRRHSASWT